MSIWDAQEKQDYILHLNNFEVSYVLHGNVNWGL